jgi:hypothetical protein
LLALLDHADQQLRQNCIESLGRIAPNDEIVARRLRQHLRRFVQHVRKPDRQVPAELLAKGDVILSPNHPCNEIREILDALCAMGTTGAACVPTLQELAKEPGYPDLRVRIHAALASAQPEETRHIKPLIDALESSDWSVRYAALERLDAIRPELSKASLEKVGKLLDDEHYAIRWHAAYIVARSDRANRAAVAVLTEALAHAGGDLFLQACDSLSRMDGVPRLALKILERENQTTPSVVVRR